MVALISQLTKCFISLKYLVNVLVLEDHKYLYDQGYTCTVYLYYNPRGYIYEIKIKTIHGI